MLKIILALFAFTLSFQSVCKNYVIGVEDIAYYPLFDFQKGGDSYTKALFDEFARQSGHTFTYLPLPIKRFNEWLLEDNIDFKYPDNARWYSNRIPSHSLYFSDSTIRLVAGTLTAVDRNLTEKDLKVIGTLLGFYPTQWIDQIKSKQVHLYENSSTLMLIQQVLRGQVDGIDLEPSVVEHHLKLLGKPGFLAVNKNLTYEVYDFFLSTIKHQDVILEFNKFLKGNQPFLAELRRKYGIIDYRPYLQ